MRKIEKKEKFKDMIFWPKFRKISGKLKIKAKYLMRNFDEESNLHENDFLEFVLGKKFLFKFHDVFNKSWPKMNNLWKKMK